MSWGGVRAVRRRAKIRRIGFTECLEQFQRRRGPLRCGPLVWRQTRANGDILQGDREKRKYKKRERERRKKTKTKNQHDGEKQRNAPKCPVRQPRQSQITSSANPTFCQRVRYGSTKHSHNDNLKTKAKETPAESAQLASHEHSCSATSGNRHGTTTKRRLHDESHPCSSGWHDAARSRLNEIKQVVLIELQS